MKVHRYTYFPKTSKGGNIDALIDSGAELSLISQDILKKKTLPVEPLENPLHIVFADHSKVVASECVSSLSL